MTTAKPPIRPTRGPRLWLFRLLAIVVGPVLLVGLLELVLTLAGVGHAAPFVLQTTIDGERYHVANDKFTWRFFPREIARSPVPFRLAAEKPDNTCRIFVFGGSAAVGTPDHTFGFSRVLDVLLAARYPDVRFEVVNAAVTAINSHVVYQIVQDCARLDPDLFVIYMGNNEVVGPFGVGTVFAPLVESMSAIRTSLAVRSLRMGQLISSLVSSGTEASRLREWRGLEMVMNKTVAADAPALQTVYDHYRRNLRDICDVARARGIETLVSTVAVNLEDCPPFASLHAPGLDASRKAAWDQSFARGIELEVAGRHQEALKEYDAAAALDGDHAELAYRRGRCLRAVGDTENARHAFIRARLLDGLRVRADAGINRIVRDVLSEDASLHLVDAENRFAALAEDGVPGEEVFDDHVHFNFHGNYLLGLMVFEEIRGLLPDWVRQKSSPETPLPDEGTTARLLALTDWERVKIAEMIVTNLGRPPFNRQLGSTERLARLRNEVRTLRQRVTPAHHEAMDAIYRHAADQRREDHWIPYNHGQFLLTVTGDLEAAEQRLRQTQRYLPDDVVARRGLAELLTQRAKAGEAIAILDGVVESHPRDAEAFVALGKARLALGDLDRARQSFAKAVELRPDSARLRCMIAGVFKSGQQPADALRYYREALELDADFVEAHRELASLNSQLGKHAVAFEHFEKVLAIDPGDAGTHNNLGNAHLRNGELERAVHHYRRSIELDPEFVMARSNLGVVMARQGKKREAVVHLEEALRRSPEFETAHRTLGYVMYEVGQADPARKHLDKAVQLKADQPLLIYVALAWLYALPTPTAPADPDRAIELSRAASTMVQGPHPQVLDVLAGALAAKGEFSQAIAIAQRALELASADRKVEMAAQIQAHLELYRAGKTVDPAYGKGE
jgi:tetratricopeptide (TPR) repeat protein